MDLQILVKSSFRPISGAQVASLTPNSWTLQFERQAKYPKFFRGDLEKLLDGAVFLIDDVESEPAVMSAVNGQSVTVTVWVLP